MKWYEAVLIGGAIVGIYALLTAERRRREGRRCPAPGELWDALDMSGCLPAAWFARVEAE